MTEKENIDKQIEDVEKELEKLKGIEDDIAYDYMDMEEDVEYKECQIMVIEATLKTLKSCKEIIDEKDKEIEILRIAKLLSNKEE